MRWSLSVEEGMQDPGPNPINRLKHLGPGPDQLFAGRERQQILARTLKEFPADFRRALYLCYVHGLSIREAACTLGVNQQTLKVRLFRGRRKLARSLSTLNHGVHFASFQTRRERNENSGPGGATNTPVPDGLLA
jgi:DNA-directed RNA polymerase specialized sigma24 family protein